MKFHLKNKYFTSESSYCFVNFLLTNKINKTVWTLQQNKHKQGNTIKILV